MKTFVTTASLAIGATAAILPRTDECCFQLAASGGLSGSLGQLDDGQNRVGGGLGQATYCINGGKITDESGRGCILTGPTTQFQCDMGTAPQGGFSINSNGMLQHSGDSTFYACPADQGEYNIYTEKIDNQPKCVEVMLNTGGKCAAQPMTSNTCPPAQTVTQTKQGKPTTVYQTQYKTKTQYKPTTEYSTEYKPTTQYKTEYSTEYKPTTVYNTEYSTEYKPTTEYKTEYSTEYKPTTEYKTEYSTEYKPTTVYQTKTMEETEYVTKPTTVYQTKTEQETITAKQPTTIYQTKTMEETEYVTKPTTVYQTKTEQQTVTAKPTTVYETKTEQQTVTAKPTTVYETKTEQQTVTAKQPTTIYQTKTMEETEYVTKPTTVYQTKPAMSTPTAPANGCPANLDGEYQYPHLIVPVSSEHPDQSYGTSYNGMMNGSMSSMFNFDVPASYQGKTCNLVFMFPQKDNLETSDYTFNGQGSVSVDHMGSVCKEGDSYSSAPKSDNHMGKFSPQPGNSYTVWIGDCPAGSTQSYEMSAEGGMSMEFFQDYNPCPLGLYMTTS